MTKTPCTSRYSAVLLSSLLVAVVGLTSQSAHSLQRHVRDLPSTADAQADARDHTKPNGGAMATGEILSAGDSASWRLYGPQLKPQQGEKFLHELRLPRDTSGYLAKHASPTMPCQNESNSCRVILPAEEAANYSPQQHPPKFFLCLATVVCRDECTLKCTAPVETPVPEKPLVTAEKETEQPVSFEKSVERQVGALDVKLAKLIETFESQKNKLVELGQHLKHLNDTFQGKLTAASASTLGSVESKARELKALLNEKTVSMTTTISSVLFMAVINPKTHRWTLTGYAGLKARAVKDGWFSEIGEKVYLQRYLISWGIYFIAQSGHVSLHLSLQFHKGINDEFLDWPFSNEVKLCIIHPETQQEHCTSGRPHFSGGYIRFFAMPLKGSNERFYFPTTNIESSYAEKNGYIKADKLRARLEVLA